MNKFLVFLCCLSFHSVWSQSYNTSAGMRLGTEWGFSLKQRLLDSWTSEAILQTNRKKNESAITLLGVNHKAILSRRFNLFFGGGVLFPLNTGRSPAGKSEFGIVGAGGLEFTFARLNISWDYLPVFVPGDFSFNMQSAMTIRYVLKKREHFPWESKNKKRFSLPIPKKKSKN